MKDLQPLHIETLSDLRNLALDGFPIIDDFSVVVTTDESRTIEFRSAAHGRLAGFPAWEYADRDLRHFTPSDVPLGTLDEPFEDRDEAWRIILFGDSGWIYVLEGDAPAATEFRRWFRVATGGYVQAWAALIDFFNPAKPLDAIDAGPEAGSH